MKVKFVNKLVGIVIVMFMVLSVIQIMPVDIEIVETASAASTWFEGDWSTAGSFDQPNSSFIDATTYPGEVRISYEPELIISDFGNDRIVKTKMDGSSWAAYGSTGAGVGEFNAPTSLTYDNETGFVYVAEWTNNNITRTRFDGSGWLTYGTLGGGVGNFNNPRGIDRDDETGYIYVTDGSNNRLVKTLMNGSYWQTYNNAGDSFSNPIAVHLYNGTGLEELYVAGFTKNRIVKTQMDGTGWTTLGGPLPGSGVGEFDNPSGIFMDNSTGTEWIYVSDNGNARIVKTQIDGTGWTTLGTSGSGIGQFNQVRAIYYNNVTDFLYIADINNDRIVKTKMDGTGWETFGTPGSGVGQLDSPYGLDVGNFSYLANANMSSKSFNVGPSSYLINITWNANVPANTGLKFQIRSADTKANLAGKSFVGPDGSIGTYYTSGGQNIWPGHNGDAFIQYKVYFNTSDLNITPILYSVDINYNLFPAPPDLTNPPDDSWTNDDTPTFTWDFVDYDPGAYQTAYRFQLDNDNGFGNPENDTGNVTSGISSYTPAEPIADGTWYWRVRTKDEDNNWSTYSAPWSIKIDTQDPTSAITYPLDGVYYNSVTTITGTASDGAMSGIAQVRVTIQNLTTSEYWDGTKWVVSQTWLLCTGTNAWNYNTASISWNSANQYKIISQATDNVTNTETAGAGITFNFDTQNPSSSVTTPVDSGFYNSLTTISGTAGDGPGAGVSFVNVSIKRIVDNSYWSGVAWTIGPEIWLTATGTTSWTFGPVGALWNSDNQYTVRSRATDNATNVEVPGAGNTFSYDASNPSSSITSPPDSSYVNSVTSITGTASDTGGAAVDFVNISIKRNSDNLYWDGSGWIVSEIWLNTTGTTSWTRDTGLPAWVTGVSYTIRSKAVDTATNEEVASAGNTFEYDTDDPSSTVTTPVDSTFYNSLTTISGTASDGSGSGIAFVNLSIQRLADSSYWNGSAWIVGPEIWLTAAGTTSWSFVPVGPIWNTGFNYTVRSRATDNATNVETPGAGNTFTFDDLAPISFIGTPSNGAFVNSLSTIAGSAVDMGSAGIDYVNVSIMDDGSGLYWNGTAWVAGETWLAVTGTTTWSLNTGLPTWVSGNYYTIRSRATDIVPNTETPGSGNNFLFDSEMPSALITNPINDTIVSSLTTIMGTASDIGGSGLQNIQLQIVRVSDDANWNGTAWNTTATSWSTTTGTTAWSYSGVNWVSDEWYKIRTSVEDNATNNNVSNDWIWFYFDNQDPSPLSVLINNGSAYTNTTSVTLNLSALDSGSGVNRIAFSDDGLIWSSWETYSQYRPYNLLAGDGIKIVFFMVEDLANNTAFVNDTIYLDTVAPSFLSVVINDDDTYTNSSIAQLDLGATDLGSGLNRMKFSYDGILWTSWEPFAPTKVILLTAEGQNTVYFMVEDMANNSAVASDTIILDTVAPYDLSIEINNGELYTNSVFLSLELNATDDTSGVYQMAMSTNGTDWSEWADFQTSFSPTLLGPDGLYTIYIKVRDYANNTAGPVSDSIYLDRQAPDPMTITINDGADYTNLDIVQLKLSATETGSGLWEMAFSNDGVNYNDWETFALTKSYTLPAGDGLKTVYYKVRDYANNTGFAQDSIILDVTPPIELSIIINDDDMYTNDENVELNLSAIDNTSGIYQMAFSTDGTTWTDWELFNTTKSYTLPTGDGPKAIYFKVSDRANNTAFTQDTIILDTTPPDPISIVVNDDDEYTGSRTVTLTLSATDTGSGIDQMAFSSNSLNWTAWEPFSETKTFDLPEGDGIQIAYVRVSDRAGNYDSEGDSIILDTEPPHSLSILIEDDDAETDDVNVSLTLLAIDEVSGVVEMAFSTDGITWTDWETYSNDKDFELPAGDGEKTVYFKVRDLVGNEANPVSDNITLKTEGPSDDKDTDGDGYDDDVDEFPTDPTEWADNDGDNIGDNADTDDDNDEFFDEWEEWMGTDPKDATDKPADTDGDGAPDGEPGNTKPWMDTDDDGDGYTDQEELDAKTDPLDSEDYPIEKDTDDDGEDYTMYLLILIVIIIIVVVLALAMRGKGKGKEEEEPAEGEEAIEEEGVMDVGEGAVAPPVGAPVVGEEEAYEEEEFECPTCGAPLTADATVCTECGEEFEDDEE